MTHHKTLMLGAVGALAAGLGGPSVLSQAVAAEAPAGAAAAAPPTKASNDPLTLSRYVFPGSSQFFLAGYATAGFSALRHSDAAFQAQFNPLFLWKASDRLLFEGELEMELEDGETETKLEQAHLSYLLHDYVTFDAGKFLNPMNSFVERFHMGWVNRLPDKPLAVYDGLLPETYVGAQLRGGLPLGEMRLNYSGFVANAPKFSEDGDEATGTLDFDNYSNEGGNIASGGHLGFQLIPELEIGYGIHYSGVADSDEHVFLHSIDLNYVRGSDLLRGSVRVNAQWVWSRLGTGTYDNNGNPDTFRNDRQGGYAQVAYRPTKVDTKWLRKVEGVFRYDRFEQKDTPVGYDESRYTVGLNYWLTSKTVLKAAYQFDDKSSGAEDNSGVWLQFAFGF